MSLHSLSRRVALAGLPLLALAAAFVAAPAALATSDDDLLQQHVGEYLSNTNFCCIPGQASTPLNYSPQFGLSGGGLCEPNYGDITVCKASGGVIFTEIDGAQCARSCGLKAGLYYCSKAGNYCSQNPPSTGVAVGYATSGDCALACKPKGPIEVKTVACRCTDEGKESVTCDIVVGPPGSMGTDLLLQKPISTPPPPPLNLLLQGGGTSSVLFQNPIYAPTSSSPGAYLQRESPFASLLSVPRAAAQTPPPPGTSAGSPSTSTSQSDNATVRFWLQTGSPDSQNWAKIVTYMANTTDAVEENLVATCELGQCDVSVARQEGVISVTFDRSVISSESITEMAARVLQGEDDDTTVPTSVYDTKTGAIPTVTQCEDRKSGTIACYDQYGNEQSSGQGGHPEVSYTLKVPNVIQTITVQDDINGQYSDKYDCLDVGDGSEPKLTLENNVTIRTVGGTVYTPLQCSSGSEPESTCCSIDLAPDDTGSYRAQLTCTIVPPLRSTAAGNDYEIAVSGIKVFSTPECVDKPVDNIAWTWPNVRPDDYEGSNVTSLTVPSCQVNECDVCWIPFDSEGEVKTQETCEQDAKCQWVNDGGGSPGVTQTTEGGYCRPRVGVCPGYIGCCYWPLITIGETQTFGKYLAWGGVDSEGGSVEGKTYRQVSETQWQDITGGSNQQSFDTALSCFPMYSTASATGVSAREAQSVFEGNRIPSEAEINKMKGACETYRTYDTTYTSSASSADEAASASYSSEKPERDDLWCPSGDLTDLEAELIADAGNAALIDINDESVDPSGTWLPNYTTARHNMQNGGLVYFRYPRFNPFGNASDFYKRNSGNDPQYDDDPALNTTTQDGYAACMEGKRIAICLAGDPAKASMNCGVTDASECVDGGGTVLRNGPTDMDLCYFLSVILNDNGSWDGLADAPVPAAANAAAANGGQAGNGNNVGQDVIDFFSETLDMIAGWFQ